MAAAILTVIAVIAVTSFAWPAANLAPRDVPIGVVGPAHLPPGTDAHAYPTEAAAAAAIRDREVYGAIVASAAPPRVLIATAASPAVAQMLRQAAPQAQVQDLVPPPSGDPRGAALSGLVLPLTLVGVITGVLGFFLFSGTARLGWLTSAAAGTGLITVAIVQGGFDALAGDWVLNAGVIGLAVLAVSAAVSGLASIVGRPGIVASALLMMLVGNPWSGMSSAPELLPEPAGTIGQLLPPGAAGDLLRSVAFFDGAAAAAPLAVLAVWALAGLTGVAVAARRATRAVPAVAV